MGLIIRKGRGAKARPMWYARITRDGCSVSVSLKVPIAGVVPVDARGKYDIWANGGDDYNQSRLQALQALDALRAALPAKSDNEGVTFSQLPALWRAIKRNYTPTASWDATITTWFRRFAVFAVRYTADHGGRCKSINDITPAMAAAWFDEIKIKYAWSTVKKQWGLLRAAYRRFATRGAKNPFEDVIMRNRELETARIARVPLTGEQLERLIDLTRGRTELHDVIVAAASTGMRIGDVCNLKWADVDLRGGMIHCITAKAGKRVTIPILPRLRAVLDQRATLPNGARPAAAVFPAAAARYSRNPDGLYREVKPFFARAVYGDETQATDVDAAGNTTRSLPDALDAAGVSNSRRGRLLAVYNRIKAGEKSIAIAAAMGTSRAQVSMDLRDIEKMTGERLRPKAKKAARVDISDRTRQRRLIGCRAASIYGWHSLRATFVVLAVNAGVPVETVQLIVGHSTAQMTMEYYNPTAQHAAERLRSAMTNTALGGNADSGIITVSPVALALAVLPAATRETAERIIAAAGAAGDEERAMALISAMVDDAYRARINAVLSVAT